MVNFKHFEFGILSLLWGRFLESDHIKFLMLISSWSSRFSKLSISETFMSDVSKV